MFNLSWVEMEEFMTLQMELVWSEKQTYQGFEHGVVMITITQPHI